MGQSKFISSTASKAIAAVSALIFVLSWTFARVSEIRPAILGDEWVYTMSSRYGELWGSTPDPLGNYLFNAIYRVTLACGPDFYFCGKVLNLAFFGGFLAVLFLIAIRYLNYYLSAGLVIAFGLSPLSVYTSMYLPESLYFSLLGLTVYFVSRAISSDHLQDWLLAGTSLGLAALVKPHALLSLIPLAIFVALYSLEKRDGSRILRRSFSALAGFVLARFLVGFVIAGPKALNVFTSYGLGDAFATVTGGGSQTTESATNTVVVGSGPIDGVIALFPSQAVIHSQVLIALLGVPIAVLLWNLVYTFTPNPLTDGQRFALLALIWLLSMTISIVAFTGWITGSGDDHTTRVLLRYYDFLFPVVVIASLSAISDSKLTESRPWMRWASSGLILAAASPAFAGAFGSLQIQIADAPNLAGLVVNRFVFDSIAILVFLGLLILAFFPRLTKWPLAVIATWTLVATGFQAQGQYIQFRGADQAADIAGKALYELKESIDLENVLVIANSRFDARVASLWMDADNEILLLNPGALVPSSADQIDEYALLLGDTRMEGNFEVLLSGEGFEFVRVED